MSTFALLSILLASSITAVLVRRLRRPRSTPLRGPPSTDLIFGVTRSLTRARQDNTAVLEQWAAQYGSVFQIPAVLGSTQIILCDPKAIAHFYSLETYGYVYGTFTKIEIDNVVGRGLLYAEGDSHKRQRKAISPAFSNDAIRQLTAVFFDSAYKLKDAWDTELAASSDDTIVVEVQHWMNYVSLDSIGIAGFSHDFGSLRGAPSTVASVLDAFATLEPSVVELVTMLLSSVFPVFMRVPTPSRVLERRLSASMGEIADELLRNVRTEKDGAKTEDKSIIGLLIKAEGEDAELHLSQEEILAQMKVLILAGYETTSSSLTWALIELCRKPETQALLRAELAQFPANDPTWEQLSALPYLDAVVHEVLRLHPPLETTTRVAAAPDVLPLSTPLVLPDGRTTDRIAIARGQLVSVPISAVNRAAALWGVDAHAFAPARWLAPAGLPAGALGVQGHRHLLTFVDGARTCLGRGFALAEFKAVLSVLVRNYAFELRDGPDTPIEVVEGLLSRPKVACETGTWVPLRVRRVE